MPDIPMSDMKGAETYVQSHDSQSQQDVVSREKQGTHDDQRDMMRMGKNQELRRNFSFVPMFGYSMVLMATWEAMLTTIVISLTNGGTGGAIVMYIVTVVGMGLSVASMAEMASMAPTSGGQYHWVSEFSPTSCQKFLSYLVGWLSVLGYQTGVASIAFLAANQIQGLVILSNESYSPERWHGTLIVIAVTLFAVIFNTLLARKLPLVEGIVLTLHVFGFFAFLITMWVLGPRSEAKQVFSFQDNAGWNNVGLSVLVGQLAPIFAFIGADAATHMSEELRDASYTLPRAMMSTIISNSIMGFIILITACFVLGDVESIINTPTGQPHIQMLYNITHSIAGTTVLSLVLIIMVMFGCVNIVSTASRQLFAFARDHGLPYSAVLSRVTPGWDIPLNSVAVCFVVTVLLSFINIGSTTAFNSIASLGTSAFTSSYIISIGCMFIKRWRNEPLLPSKFNLGKAGIWINGISVVYLSYAFVFMFFPTSPNPTADVMNWNIVIYGFVVLFCLGYYLVKGRKVYVGPVEYINKNL